MANWMKRIVVGFCVMGLQVILTPPSYAQAANNATAGYVNPIADITMVGACTIGGAVLGLSTLPFTEEPGDHLKNILVGGAVGLIVGVALVAYLQADTTNTFYTGSLEQETPELTTRERLQWHQEDLAFEPEVVSVANSATAFQYSFRF